MKKIIIIGSGIGGLTAGVYGQMNGYKTTIFESHSIAGGQCTSWKRKGYTFDPTLHMFNGFKPNTKINSFWKETGALPCEMVKRNEYVSSVSEDGTTFHNYFDTEKLENHLKSLAPEDSKLIDEYVNGIKAFTSDLDWFGINYFGSFLEKLSIAPFFLARLKYFKYTMGSFGKRFKNPLLHKAIPLVRNAIPEVPLFAYLAEHCSSIIEDIGWPKGGSITIAQNIAKRYEELGGEINFNKKVIKILTEINRACGIELEDGTKHYADYVISNADGRKTILDLLDGKFANKKIISFCDPNPEDKDVHMSVQLFLGVKRDLSNLPSSMILFLDKPVTIGSTKCNHLDLQLYGYDPSMAPEGKGVIKIELPLKPSYFSQFANNKVAYKETKEKITKQVIKLLNSQFPDIEKDIEVTDLCTLLSWEHFMKGSHGFNNFPNKHRELTDIRNILDVLFGLNKIDSLPKLKNFYFAGQWVTSMGSLFTNAASGRSIIQKICKQNKVNFKSNLN